MCFLHILMGFFTSGMPYRCSQDASLPGTICTQLHLKGCSVTYREHIFYSSSLLLSTASCCVYAYVFMPCGVLGKPCGRRSLLFPPPRRCTPSIHTPYVSKSCLTPCIHGLLCIRYLPTSFIPALYAFNT